jgi:hypothetical protein
MGGRLCSNVRLLAPRHHEHEPADLRQQGQKPLLMSFFALFLFKSCASSFAKLFPMVECCLTPHCLSLRPGVRRLVFDAQSPAQVRKVLEVEPGQVS